MPVHPVDPRIGGLPATGQTSGLKLWREAGRSNTAPTHLGASGDSDPAHIRSHSRLSLTFGESGRPSRLTQRLQPPSHLVALLLSPKAARTPGSTESVSFGNEPSDVVDL